MSSWRRGFLSYLTRGPDSGRSDRFSKSLDLMLECSDGMTVNHCKTAIYVHG